MNASSLEINELLVEAIEQTDSFSSFKESPFVSVIIPVYNDNERLKICLDSLEKQTYPKHLYEVIVVDNGSETSIELLVQQFNQAVATYEGRPGSYVARNKGISLAKGEVIAFTDSDCIPNPDWIEKGVTALQSKPNLGLVAGKIDLFFKVPDRPNAIELYDSIVMGFPQDEFIMEGHFGATANVFTFKAVINRVGGFDETLKANGDRQWGQKVFANGYKQLYAEDVCIHHPTRHEWQDLHKKSVRHIGGKYDVLKKSLSDWELFKNLLRFLKPPCRSFYHIWTDKRLNGISQKTQFTIVMLRIRMAVIQERLKLQLFSGVSNRG
jgi:glycosyltransferase involved in cell wall biosynthesis